MSDFDRQRINPIEQMKALGWPTDHVTFDPTLKRGRYYIRRGSAHDGTLIFTHELIQKALAPIASRDSYCKRDEIDWQRLKAIRYRVGWLRRAAVYGMVNIPAGRYPGMRECVRIQVVPEYVYRDEADQRETQ